MATTPPEHQKLTRWYLLWPLKLLTVKNMAEFSKNRQFLTVIILTSKVIGFWNVDGWGNSLIGGHFLCFNWNSKDIWCILVVVPFILFYVWYELLRIKVYLCFKILLKGVSASHMHSCMMPSPHWSGAHKNPQTHYLETEIYYLLYLLLFHCCI